MSRRYGYPLTLATSGAVQDNEPANRIREGQLIRTVGPGCTIANLNMNQCSPTSCPLKSRIILSATCVVLGMAISNEAKAEKDDARATSVRSNLGPMLTIQSPAIESRGDLGPVLQATLGVAPRSALGPMLTSQGRNAIAMRDALGPMLQADQGAVALRGALGPMLQADQGAVALRGALGPMLQASRGSTAVSPRAALGPMLQDAQGVAPRAALGPILQAAQGVAPRAALGPMLQAAQGNNAVSARRALGPEIEVKGNGAVATKTKLDAKSRAKPTTATKVTTTGLDLNQPL